MATKGDTRAEILRTAGRLLQSRGFNGFSYGHIAEALGIKPAAVHYHFPSKADLGVALIQRFRARYQTWMDDAEHLAPQERLQGFIGIYRRFLDDGLKACPAGVIQAEYDAVPEEVQREVRALVVEIQRWLASVLEHGRATGHFSFAGSAEDKAALVGATVQGALQVARTLGKGHFEAAIRQVLLELKP